MSQGSLQVPTVGVVSGLEMAQDMNGALAALYTANSGGSAPTNAAGGTPVLGQLWLDTTSATKPVLKQYDGANWVIVGTVNVTNSIWTPPIAGGTAVTIASGSTTDLGSVPEAYVTVSGVVTITSLGSSAIAGTIHVATFSGILTLTHNGTSLILPTAANILTAAGDTAWFVYLGSGNWKCIVYTRASGSPLSTAAVGAAQLISSSQGMNAPLNLRIDSSVGSNALTVAIKGLDGNDPSANNPVWFTFRDATIANGDPVMVSLQAALSFTVAAGNTLGTPSGNIPFRLWVISYYNGGTLAVGLFNASGVTSTTAQVYCLAEGALVTTAASTNGGNSIGTHYANVSAITNTPFRILGYLEWSAGLATAGTWASAPTKITLSGPGTRKPGDILQQVQQRIGSTATIATQIPLDNTVPQSTEGAAILSQAITPGSECNILEIATKISHSVSSAGGASIALFTSTVAGSSALAAAAIIATGANNPVDVSINYYGLAGTVTASTFWIRGGPSAGNDFQLNATGAGIFGGVSNSYMTIKEYMG